MNRLASTPRPAAMPTGERFARDRRLFPARPDLAASHLRGIVEAERFAEGTELAVSVAMAPLTLSTGPDEGLATQLLYGERFTAYECGPDWAWGQSASDGYVGYVPQTCLSAPMAAATHRVSALMTHVYPAADLKLRPIGQLTYGAEVTVTGQGTDYAELAGGGHVPLPHLALLSEPAGDWVAEAERFLGVPYLWGGRTPAGLDCSALIQLPRQAAGHPYPRDSDMQEGYLGTALDPKERLTRGDLVFWRGHVGIMLSATKLLHANAHHMAAAIEPLATARGRIRRKGEGPVTRYVRLD